MNEILLTKERFIEIVAEHGVSRENAEIGWERGMKYKVISEEMFIQKLKNPITLSILKVTELHFQELKEIEKEILKSGDKN